MKILETWLLIGVLKICCTAPKVVAAVHKNRPPRFVAGGDMAHFSIPEDMEVGSTVYKLRATDPEDGAVYFSISGEFFSVNKYSGDVTLTKKLDREVNNTVEVIISVTDETTSDEEPSTVSLRREIPIIDVNDNLPLFGSSQYSFSISEGTKIGTVVYNNITISDKDFGLNSMVNLFCVQSLDCRVFSISLQIMSEGFYKASIMLIKPLNYETQSSYSLWLKAIDSNPKKPLSTMAKVIIDVEDIQDQPPIFLNTPYSISIFENMPLDQKVLSIRAKDGDVKNLRPIIFSIEQDVLKYFSVQNHGDGNATIVTTDNPIDREDPLVKQMGGIYTFNVKATELINNEVPGDETRELVTIVILDQNDQLPNFNKPVFHLNVSEDIGIGTPLPSFGMVVNDDDIGENAHFSLSLQSSDPRFANCFSVEPSVVTGRSPVIIRVVDNEPLDYENNVREIKLFVIAYVFDQQNLPMTVSSAEVILNIIDANDHYPEFPQSNYVVSVPENTDLNTRIANITASDSDSGLFSQISYSIGGFGMEKFDTDATFGGLILIGRLNYEQQLSYSLTLEAKDGGNKTTTANILVNVIDVNDNAPEFEQTEYRRNLREGSTSFQPPFFVKATDADRGENNNITYSVVSTNSDAVTVDKHTGEMILLKPASSFHTSRGQYELKIQANDSGTPALSSLTQVFIRVGIPGNQRPIFKGLPYNVTISETLAANSLITTVRATDPDGPDELIEYKITSGADNFYIKSSNGKIYLSENADLYEGGKLKKKYNITVFAIDTGVPVRETAQATVIVNVLDINNKKPLFKKDINYVAHLSERTPFGSVVMRVQADDPDEDANIKYSVLKPMKIFDRRGFPMKEEVEDYSKSFGIDEDTGEISLLRGLRNPLIHFLTMTVEARDKNAVEDVENQFDRVEVTFFIETTDELKPVFLNVGWMRSNPVIVQNMFEEEPIGSTILKVVAHDPLTMVPITKFETKSLPRQLAMDPLGNVVVTERIDYETLATKKFSFMVYAISEDEQRRSDARVIINIQDINDHEPEFQYKNYQGSVEENSRKGTAVLFVKAEDGDLPSSPYGYGNISYYLSGEHAFLFDIDPVIGEIKVGNNAVIDREKQPLLNVIAVAVDTPRGGRQRRKAEAAIKIDVLDVNDNAPTFKEKEYSVVLLENTPVDSSVINLTATDPDSGPSGNITYGIINDFENFGLFHVNASTGEISVRKSLTGRGRASPYSLTVRAEDDGDPSLFTDVQVNILIGDVVSNDGIPMFIHPTEDEIAVISEDAPIGSPVFHVVGTDPDDAYTPEGQIQYSFLRDSTDADTFNIDAKTGMITTNKKLDREKKNSYSLIILLSDRGSVPQQATRVLHVNVNDVDDNVPLFDRALDEKPIRMSVDENVPVDTVVGEIQADDADEDRNAQIGYIITDGNDGNLFDIVGANESSAGVIRVAGQIDREKISQALLTVKCFKKREVPRMLHKKYNKTDLTERQILVKINDIDDSVAKFEEENVTIGVGFNVPTDTLVLPVIAHDSDAEAEPIIYGIASDTFTSLKTKTAIYPTALPFSLNNGTGELRTNASLAEFVDGFFTLDISARNSPSSNASATVKIYVIRERSLLSFVFSKTPSEVKGHLSEFKAEIEEALELPSMLFNIYNTQFYSKSDGNVDFSRTSSCFQIITDDYTPKETEILLKDESNEQLKRVYQKYNVQAVQRCGNHLFKPDVTWVQISLLSIAAFIGVTSLISACLLCCSYSRWQRLR